MVALTRHAHSRVVEFGLGLDVVTEIANHPDVAHTNRLGESVRVSDRHPDWTVVVGHDDVVITVLRRTRDRWEHDLTPSSTTTPTPRRVTPAPAEDAREEVIADPPRRPSTGRRRRPTPALQARGVVVSLTVDPDALALARVLADGDPRRLRFNRDGSVTVLNKPR